jgi:glucose-6-phosphate isomerase
MNSPRALPEWQELSKHYQKISGAHMRTLFAEDYERNERFSLEVDGIFLDFSKNRLTQETLDKLIALAYAQNLPDKIKSLFSGAIVNHSEQSPALHTALRLPATSSLWLNDQDLVQNVQFTLAQMQAIVEKIHTKRWLGYSGKCITDVVNIGIGGSYLGPAMAYKALTPYINSQVNCHFVANIDGAALADTLKQVNPETTLFVIASKTFTTHETLYNTQLAKKWLFEAAGNDSAFNQHFIAVTAYPARAEACGFAPGNILTIGYWVGGRYSLWSAMGLSLAIGIGMDNFKELLAGAHAIDQHFITSPLAQNMPVLLALISIWYINFFGAKTQAILPYCNYLSLLPTYLQQLEMESNGKNIQQNGQPVDYATAPVLWGDVGTNGQHAFHQLLFQGTQLVPVDFIIAAKDHHCSKQHQILLANCLAQSHALMEGITNHQTATHQQVIGNQPSNTIMIKQLTPYTLGSLLSLYEHKVYTQSVIWNINCFDQWGVELGKKIANNLAEGLRSQSCEQQDFAVNNGLLAYYWKAQNYG